MAILTTRWRPDTCKCVVVYGRDDSLPAATAPITLVNIENKCPIHSSLSDQNTFNTLFEENPRKNNTLAECLEQAPAITDITAEGSKALKDGLTYNFTWSGTAPNRVLNISFSGVTLTTAQRNGLQSALNAKFGVGKVILA